jgi:hypothetical protein
MYGPKGQVCGMDGKLYVLWPTWGLMAPGRPIWMIPSLFGALMFDAAFLVEEADTRSIFI